jgi:hypothetical protein
MQGRNQKSPLHHRTSLPVAGKFKSGSRDPFGIHNHTLGLTDRSPGTSHDGLAGPANGPAREMPNSVGSGQPSSTKEATESASEASGPTDELGPSPAASKAHGAWSGRTSPTLGEPPPAAVVAGNLAASLDEIAPDRPPPFASATPAPQSRGLVLFSQIENQRRKSENLHPLPPA